MYLHFPKIVLTALVLIILCACSSSDEQAEKGRIKQTTDKIAHEAVSAIKTPIDQAKMAKELTEQHNSAVEKNADTVVK